MDNLDRTGVVQGALAKRVLNLQLTSLGVLPEGSTIDNYEDLSAQFRESKLMFDCVPSLVAYGL